MSTFLLNLKIIYCDLTRILNTKGEHGWDTVVPVEISDGVIKALSYFFKMEEIQIQRKAIFAKSTHINFKLFFDGSIQAVEVTVIVQNILPNNDIVNRLL